MEKANTSKTLNKLSTSHSLFITTTAHSSHHFFLFIYMYTLQFLNYKCRTERYSTIGIYIGTATFDLFDECCSPVHNTISHIHQHHSPFDCNIVHPFPNCPAYDLFRNNLAMLANKQFPCVSVFAVFSASQVT